MNSHAILPLALSVLLVACNGSREPTVQQPAIELSRLSQDDGSFAVNSGYQKPTNLVIRDSVAWAEAWGTLHDGVDPMPPLPAIDFAGDMVVLVAIGEQPNGGHSVRITSVRPDGEDGLLVSAVHSAAGPSCMVPQMLTAPADLARVRASTATVRFVVEHVTRDCVDS